MSLPKDFTKRLFQKSHQVIHDGNSFRASVALILCHHQWSLLVIKRARNEKDPWSGHYGFPGGMIEKGESPKSAVKRECLEEIGIDLDHAQFLGGLDPYPISYLKNALIYPHIFFIESLPKLTLDALEVEQAFFWPLDKIVRKDSFVRRDFKTSVGVFNRPAIKFEDHLFWGISLGILNELFTAWQGLDAPWRQTVRPFNLS